jgi:hypothetical protein
MHAFECRRYIYIYMYKPWKGEVGVGLGRHDRKIGIMGRQR